MERAIQELVDEERMAREAIDDATVARGKAAARRALAIARLVETLGPKKAAARLGLAVSALQKPVERGRTPLSLPGHWGGVVDDGGRRHYVPGGDLPGEAKTACERYYFAHVTGDVSTNVYGTTGAQVCAACLAAYEQKPSDVEGVR